VGNRKRPTRQEAERKPEKGEEDQRARQDAERKEREEEQRWLKAEQERARQAERKKREEDDKRDLLEMSFGAPVAGEILYEYEGLLRRRKADHGRCEDPYKTVCVCRLQGSVLRVRLTHNGEVVGMEEQFDLKREWRPMPRSDKAQLLKSSLYRVSLLYSKHTRTLTLGNLCQAGPLLAQPHDALGGWGQHHHLQSRD